MREQEQGRMYKMMTATRTPQASPRMHASMFLQEYLHASIPFSLFPFL
jgi:hypothetical protein